MDRQSNVIVLALVVSLIIVSAFFTVYLVSNSNLEPPHLSKDLVPRDDIHSKDNLLQVFDSPQIKVDILIPSKRNDGTIIENEKFDEIRTELAARFGGVTLLPHFNGTSVHNETRYDGVNNSGFYVVVPNTIDNLKWFANYKQILKDKLEQDRIFMTFSPTMIVP